MTALNPNDPLSRLIGVEAATSSDPSSFSGRTVTDLTGAVAGVNGVTQTADSASAGEREEDDKDYLSPEGAKSPVRPRHPRAPKRSPARRTATRDGRKPDTPATEDDVHRINDTIDAAGTDESKAGEFDVLIEDAGRSQEDSEDEVSRAEVLEQLASTIDSARAFAERWDAPYQSEIFRVALGALLGDRPVDLLGGVQAHGLASGGRGAGSAQVSRGGTQEGGGVHAAGGGLAPTVKLARKLGVDVEGVERVVMFGDDYRITIIGHVEGKTKKELQTKYGLVYCFIKEIALGDPLVDIEELRALCVEHGCYDLGNFTGNFRKDVKSGSLREIGAKGSRVRKYRLAKKGLDEAGRLLREMAEQ